VNQRLFAGITRADQLPYNTPMVKLLLFACTLSLSAALIFLIEFTCAKMVLPLLGGTPAVWNTCLVFFQAGLLLGYAYAHFGPLWLGVRRHAVIHLGLWLLAFLVMPFHLATARVGNPPEEPIFWLLWLLTISIGFPFVLLSSTGPLVQRWFARRAGSVGDRRNPYALYAASNLGSMLGLVLYPIVVEPNLTLAEQNWVWTWVFVGLFGLLIFCAGWRKNDEVPERPHEREPASQGGGRLRWVLLALAPSSLMMSVTSYLTTDIAPIPLLWMLPMALYLGSFVLVFAWHQTPLQAWLVRWLPGVVLIVLVVPLAEGTEPIWLILAIHLIGFYWIAVVCHGELARSKPAAEHLTEFYLWIAVGGVLGGMFNALAAPLLFNSILEYPLALILVGWLNPLEKDVRANAPSSLTPPRRIFDGIAPLLIASITVGLVMLISSRFEPGSLSAFLMFGPPGLLCLLAAEKPARFGLCLAGLFAASSFYHGMHGKPTYRQRSFFGVHRVTEANGFRQLVHGNTVHGMESLDPRRQGQPLTYYHKNGPIGMALLQLADMKDPRLKRVGIVGLGTGALAYYARPDQRWTFFEIDPAVKHIAAPETGLFTFLKNRPMVNVVLGDGRLTLQESSEKFGVIIIDAFGSDSIPLHLLTREALGIYRARLKPGGILVFHISNRYFHLEPVLANLAEENKWTCKIRHDGTKDEAAGKEASIWLVMGEDLPNVFRSWLQATGDASLRAWTDDFSNVFQILKWGGAE